MKSDSLNSSTTFYRKATMTDICIDAAPKTINTIEPRAAKKRRKETYYFEMRNKRETKRTSNTLYVR